MKEFTGVSTSLLHDESGQDVIEYAVVAGLIGLGAMVAMATLSSTIGDAFTSVGTSLSGAV